MANKLSTQTSPYLLQHANNPVDWHPWGEQALTLAREQDKPILLSIGYSACHWCHVMERESFENDAIAATMNELFVCIKVDREERPDLDRIYQTAHQMLAQRPGGWPLTLALTPRGHAPFFAGTYFPPEPRSGMPGFGDVLTKVAQHYDQHREQMGDHHRSFEQALAQLNPESSVTKLPQVQKTLDKAVKNLSSQFDDEFGGFGSAPKFPHPTQLELLLRHCALNTVDNQSQSLRMLDLTLRKMAQGGLFDQLAGGFYRYSVDRQWCIPHFEKMLYDNAQLLSLYSDAYQFFGDSFYRNIVEKTAAWIVSEMQLPHGGYASTLDADSEGTEGKYYVWSEPDLRALLTAAEYEAIESYFGLAGEPNFEGYWHFNINPEIDDQFDPSLEGVVQSAMTKLLTERKNRIRPGLDDKILTAWNGMMIKGMARAARVLGRNDLVKSAQDALDFIRATMWQDGKLFVTSRDGETHLNGYLDDYAFLIEGIIDLLQAKWRSADLAFAIEICDAMLSRFEDPELGGFFFTSNDHEKLLYRPKPGPDDAIPSGNGAAASVLFRLGHLLGNSDYLKSAEKSLQLFAPALRDSPSVYGSLTMAMQAGHPSNKIIIIRGQPKDLPEWQSLGHRVFQPDRMVLGIPADAANLPEALARRKARKNTLAYVCQGFECSAPIESIPALESALGQAVCD